MHEKDTHYYEYVGPVCEFDKCIVQIWKGNTRAVTEAKARSNLIFQFKMKHGRTANTKITLPGIIKQIV